MNICLKLSGRGCLFQEVVDMDGVQHSNVTRFAWQHFLNVLQSGNTKMILSAVG